MSTGTPRSFNAYLESIGKEPLKHADLPVVCIQGLGFVGAAMSFAAAAACDERGLPRYNVVGVELPTEEGIRRARAIGDIVFPFECTDRKLSEVVERVRAQRNLFATTDNEVYRYAETVVVDVHCDVTKTPEGESKLMLGGIQEAVRTIAERVPPGALIVVETTVPPGTCEKVLAPAIDEALSRRGLPQNSIHLAHAYERVMPGVQYYDSIVNFWRVFAGRTPAAADKCERFLSSIINTQKFPLWRLHSMTASETAKVLENSYRAMNIAFIEEWGRFAEVADIDLFEVISAIRVRPTHSNIRQPGFGVGGYCLTKDPYFAELAAKELFHRPELRFPLSNKAVEINSRMPLRTLGRLRELLSGVIKGQRILLLGVSYRQDVGDTRYSPSEIFARAVLTEGAELVCSDPLVDQWSEMNLKVERELPSAKGFDAVIFAVSHDSYRRINLDRWLGGARPLILDANDVLTREQRLEFRERGCAVYSIGRGDSQ